RGQGQGQHVHGPWPGCGGDRECRRRGVPGAWPRRARGGGRRRARRGGVGGLRQSAPVGASGGQRHGQRPDTLFLRRGTARRCRNPGDVALMRLLLIAYEFPPSPSPQSLRWTYLVRELALQGHEVHVLTADLGGTTPGLPPLPDSVRVQRTFPGLLRGALAMHRDYRQRNPRKPASPPATDATPAGDASPTPLTALRPPRNWKQRLSEAVQAAAAMLHFPDIRGEWRRHGRRALRRLLVEL